MYRYTKLLKIDFSGPIDKIHLKRSEGLKLFYFLGMEWNGKYLSTSSTTGKKCPKPPNFTTIAPLFANFAV